MRGALKYVLTNFETSARSRLLCTHHIIYCCHQTLKQLRNWRKGRETKRRNTPVLAARLCITHSPYKLTFSAKMMRVCIKFADEGGDEAARKHNAIATPSGGEEKRKWPHTHTDHIQVTQNRATGHCESNRWRNISQGSVATCLIKAWRDLQIRCWDKIKDCEHQSAFSKVIDKNTRSISDTRWQTELNN